MITCKLTPSGWQCSLEDCPPGLFTYLSSAPAFITRGECNAIGFKSEYGKSDGGYVVEAFNDAGEYLTLERDKLVQPVEVTWGEE